MQRVLFGFLIAFIISFAISPLIIKITKKLKFGQNILHYVVKHNSKQGTPTMGGLIFIIGICAAYFILTKHNSRLGYIVIASTVGYGILGFLDDFLKIKRKNNLGLRAYQKFAGQALIAIIIAVFVYTSPLVPNAIKLPFTNKWIHLGWGIIPFIIFVFLSVTNGVNLTDGLDGLAAGVSTVFLMGFLTVLQLLILKTSGQVLLHELNNLSLLCGIGIGALFAYLCFNCFPAKIFMGDTGSLALGAFIASLTILTGLELFVLILGVMFVVSTVSVILQVGYFKITKGKRIFLMAPLHHHYQEKGVNESKIVSIYLIITIVISVLAILLEIKFGG